MKKPGGGRGTRHCEDANGKKRRGRKSEEVISALVNAGAAYMNTGREKIESVVAVRQAEFRQTCVSFEE